MTQHRPVVSFITSLRHPGTTDDYAGVEQLLHATLRSLDAQRDRRFEAVVVSNVDYQPPADLDFPVVCQTVGFACPPSTFASKDEKHDSIMLDKGLKLAVAMSRMNASHAMCLDSDDFVSRRVVEYVGAHAGEADGWYVDRGIRYDVGTGLFRPQKHFNDVCGTSLVWRRTLMPDVLLGDDPQPDEVLAGYGRDVVVNELGSHRALRKRFALAPLPFPAAVYAVNHGRNHSTNASLLVGLPIGRRRAAEYGIARPDPATTRRVAARQLRPRNVRDVVATVTARGRD